MSECLNQSFVFDIFGFSIYLFLERKKVISLWLDQPISTRDIDFTIAFFFFFFFPFKIVDYDRM